MAKPEILSQLPKERLLAALDAKHGEVVVEGWKEGTGRGIVERIAELKDLVSGFLVTFVEREGRMGGTDMELARTIVEAAAPAKVIIAGGVTTPEEVAELDAMGADCQVGMALYSGRLDLGEAIAAPLTSDRPDGLIPTIVSDERGTALGLVYSSKASIAAAVNERRGIYQSRKRGLWRKGESSGAVQQLIRVTPDCDRDSVRFIVRQEGAGFCHLETRTCFGDDNGLGRLSRRLLAAKERRTRGLLHRKALRRSFAARRQDHRGSGRAERGPGARRGDLGSRRPALFHADAARRRGHRACRGRAASRPPRASCQAP